MDKPLDVYVLGKIRYNLQVPADLRSIDPGLEWDQLPRHPGTAIYIYILIRP